MASFRRKRRAGFKDERPISEKIEGFQGSTPGKGR